MNVDSPFPDAAHEALRAALVELQQAVADLTTRVDALAPPATPTP